MTKKEILNIVKMKYGGNIDAFYKDYPTPESFKNGGQIHQYHDGGEVGHIHEGDKVVQGTHAYRKAYNEGKIATQGDGYLQAPDLREVEINAAEQEKEKMDYRRGIKKPYYKPGERVYMRPDFRGGPISRLANYAASSNKLTAKEAADLTNAGGVSRTEIYGPEVYDFYRNYFGLPLKTDAVGISKYRPTNETDPSSTYYSTSSKDLKNDIINIYNTLSPKQRDAIKKEPSIPVSGYSYYNNYGKTELFDHSTKEQKNLKNRYSTAIGEFRLGEGEDKEGKYISYYDVFDKATGDKFKGSNENLLGAAKPFEIYDRIYLKDFENISKKKNGGRLPMYAMGGISDTSKLTPQQALAYSMGQVNQDGTPISSDDQSTAKEAFNIAHPDKEAYFNNYNKANPGSTYLTSGVNGVSTEGVEVVIPSEVVGVVGGVTPQLLKPSGVVVADIEPGLALL